MCGTLVSKYVWCPGVKVCMVPWCQNMCGALVSKSEWCPGVKMYVVPHPSVKIYVFLSVHPPQVCMVNGLYTDFEDV